MTSNNNSFSLFFVITINLFIFGCCNGPYKFDIDYVFEVRPVEPADNVEVVGHQLPSNEDELGKLCDGAQECTGFKKKDTKIPFRKPEPGIVKHSFAEKVEKYFHVMWCGTEPFVYVRAGDLPNEILVLVNEIYRPAEPLVFRD